MACWDWRRFPAPTAVHLWPRTCSGLEAFRGGSPGEVSWLAPLRLFSRTYFIFRFPFVVCPYLFHMTVSSFLSCCCSSSSSSSTFSSSSSSTSHLISLFVDLQWTELDLDWHPDGSSGDGGLHLVDHLALRAPHGHAPAGHRARGSRHSDM